MSDIEKKRARPVAGTTRRAKTETAARQAAISAFNCTTGGAGRQTEIAPLLSCGKENAVPLRHLKAMVDLPGREVRRLIQAERLRGVPILSDNATGYFLPGNEQEREEFIRSMRGRAAEIEAVAAAVEKSGV